MRNLTGADIICECLIEQGVDTVFGYPGGAVLNIYDSLYNYSDKIHHVLTAHEQGASHAADGYARSTGKTGVVIATSGPGATNLVTGIATAYMDSVPMVAITGNVACSLLGLDSFQEVDITGITMPITKHNFIVKDVNKRYGANKQPLNEPGKETSTENKENIDENYEKALEIARKARKISASLLQLELHIPYSEASRIINKMEENGIIKGQKGNGRRKVNRKAFKEEE